ncbi:MAG TPA: hypothetical protein VLQ91_14280 [Draconibacterium sp.]|nr:hypothetical protein [Draconibacterium sp.]
MFTEPSGIRSEFPNNQQSPGHPFGISENSTEASVINSEIEEDAAEGWKSKSTVD